MSPNIVAGHLKHYKKLSCYCDSRSYWKIIKPVSDTSLRTAGTHDLIQRVETSTQNVSGDLAN